MKDPGKGSSTVEPFHLTLSQHHIKMERGETNTLQINLGLLCNQACMHCHLEAAPGRKENMDRETVHQVVDFARRCSFETVDITGGAPELNPHLVPLVEDLSALSCRIMVRCNLSALNDGTRDPLFDFFRAHGVVIVASLPSVNEAQLEAQRGPGLFNISLTALKKLNDMGYGHEGSGLELNLVSNPTGAFLPASQPQTEQRFRQVLARRYGIVFNHLFTFANAPLGRFRDWLLRSGNLADYMNRLVSSFNPCAADAVMCRTLVSVSWDGYLYDCDFNLAQGLYMGGRKIHVTEMPGAPSPGEPIAVADHCYTCTAGTGFT